MKIAKSARQEFDEWVSSTDLTAVYQAAVNGSVDWISDEDMARLAISEMQKGGVPVGYLSSLLYGFKELVDSDFILILDAINLAAKEVSEKFYFFKSHLIAAAYRNPEISSGVEEEDGCWPIHYLYHPSVGTSAYHDPGEEVRQILGRDQEAWPHPWSEISRQRHAFEILSNKALLDAYAALTIPGRVGTPEDEAYLESLIH